MNRLPWVPAMPKDKSKTTYSAKDCVNQLFGDLMKNNDKQQMNEET